MTDDQNIDAGAGQLKRGFKPGEKVTGEVIGITRDTVYLDVGARNDAVIERAELEVDGELSVAVGDTVTARYIVTEDNMHRLSLSAVAGAAGDADLSDAYATGAPVQGKVEDVRKGGFTIKVGGQRAFCPFSQIDRFPADDNSVYLNQSLPFMITEMSDGNIVVSRRRLMDQERQILRKELEQTLKEGDTIDGTVTRLMDFGVFVDIGGVEGLVPMRELGWTYVKSADEVVSQGDRVNVRVNGIDWEKDRISLSMRKLSDDPWSRVNETFSPGQCCHGRVVHLKPFGAFIALESGIEGLLHISKLGAGKRLSDPGEVLTVGDLIDVYIESIDEENRRISLTLQNRQAGRTMDVDGQALTVGEQATGVVEAIKPFGLFVSLNPVNTGLLHVSEIPFVGTEDRLKAMHKRFAPGTTVEVVIRSIREGKISLAMPGTAGDEFDRSSLTDEGSDSLGSLGDVLGDLKL